MEGAQPVTQTATAPKLNSKPSQCAKLNVNVKEEKDKAVGKDSGIRDSDGITVVPPILYKYRGQQAGWYPRQL